MQVHSHLGELVAPLGYYWQDPVSEQLKRKEKTLNEKMILIVMNDANVYHCVVSNKRYVIVFSYL